MANQSSELKFGHLWYMLSKEIGHISLLDWLSQVTPILYSYINPCTFRDNVIITMGHGLSQ